MSKRDDHEARGVDALIRDTSAPVYQKTSTYLRPDQIEWLDTMRSVYRKAGKRTTSASDLIRAAIDLASRHEAELDKEIMGEDL